MGYSSQPRKSYHAIITTAPHATKYISTWSTQRGGVYKVPLPYVMGHEPAGHIVSVGEGVSDYKVGDKVAVSSQSIPRCFSKDRC